MKRVTSGPGRLMSFLGVSLFVLVMISGLACRKESPAPADSNVAQPPAPVPSEPNAAQPVAIEPQMNAPVVTVNGNVVTEQELSGRVAITMRQLAGKLASLPPQYAEQVKKQIRGQVLENLVAEQLLDEQIAAAKIQITDADVEAEITKTGAQQNPPITVADFKARVEAQGGNFEDVKAEFRKGMGYRKLMEAQWGDKINVSDEDAKGYYDSHAKDFEIQEQVRASHILVSTQPKDPNADPNQVKAAAREKADKLLKQVRDGGDFAAIARENSDCPSSAQGGDLGPFTRGRMVPAFDTAAFAMKVGDVSEVVETQFGYHIIKVTERKEAGVTPFEEAKAGITERLSNEKRNAATREYIESLKNKATIAYAPGEGPAAAAPAPQPAPSQPASQPAEQPAANPPADNPPADQPAANPAPAPEPNAANP